MSSSVFAICNCAETSPHTIAYISIIVIFPRVTFTFFPVQVESMLVAVQVLSHVLFLECLSIFTVIVHINWQAVSVHLHL
jgi:hypothetical protein